MGYDFFDELSDTITRTTKDLSKRAGQLYEAQKIRSRLSSEEHMVEKLKCDIGNLLYRKYKEEGTADGEIRGLCEEIDQHMHIIAGYKDAAADLKGRKICPSCERAVDRSVSFCPYCGTPCPTPEPVKEDDTVYEEDDDENCGSGEPAQEAGQTDEGLEPQAEQPLEAEPEAAETEAVEPEGDSAD